MLVLDKIVGREGGAIPRKYRELIGLGVAGSTQRPYRIKAHVKGAKAPARLAKKLWKAH
jgi:AhpD family alkylhydroperoxidase